MDNGVLVSDLKLYLTALKYNCDHGCTVGNCEYWERSSTEFITISIDSDRVSPFTLTRILTKIGKRREDLTLFIASKANIIN